MQWRPHKSNATELHPKIEKGLHALRGKLQQAALFLQKKTKTCSVKKQKRLLAIFCFLFMAASILASFPETLRNPMTHPFIPPVKPLILQHDERPEQSLISQEVMQRIRHFKRHLDSLSTTKEGHMIRDSFLQQRPNLFDSIHYLEAIYNK